MDAYPIKRTDMHQRRALGSWHTLEKRDGDRTEARNVHGGVVIRTVVTETSWVSETTPTSSTGVGMVLVERAALMQRWSVYVVHHDPEDPEIEPCIRLEREVRIAGTGVLADEKPLAGELVISGRFRWIDADAEMPAPTDEQIRAIAAGKRAPNDLDSLRRSLSASDETAEELRELLALARAQRDTLLGGLSWSEVDHPGFEQLLEEHCGDLGVAVPHEVDE